MHTSWSLVFTPCTAPSRTLWKWTTVEIWFSQTESNKERKKVWGSCEMWEHRENQHRAWHHWRTWHETCVWTELVTTHAKRVDGSKLVNYIHVHHIEMTRKRFRCGHSVWQNESEFIWGEANAILLSEFIIDTSHCEITLLSKLTKHNKLYHLHKTLSFS